MALQTAGAEMPKWLIDGGAFVVLIYSYLRLSGDFRKLVQDNTAAITALTDALGGKSCPFGKTKP